MPVIDKSQLGNALVEAKIITNSQLKEGEKEAEKRGQPLYQALVNLQFVTEDTIREFLISQWKIASIDCSLMVGIEPDLAVIPKSTAWNHLLFPLDTKGNRLTIVITDPLKIFSLDKIASMTSFYEIEPVISSEEEIKLLIERYYGKRGFLEDSLADFEVGTNKTSIEEKRKDIINLEEADGSSTVNLVNQLLSEAIRKGASDIHIEPFANELRIRYRIDGVLYKVSSLQKEFQSAIASRIKIISNLDITEHRHSQDGHCKIRLEEKVIDLRVSITPTIFGEKVAIRVLDTTKLCLDLDRLGFESGALSIYKKNIKASEGLIIIAGPTSSGKTTTLYSTLATINSIEKNIMTIEDPVEYVLDGINQQQVKSDIGADFASGLRAFLRQDPDIILVGEIRDKETVDVVINAALTGHLVFSTLHANTTGGVITRLLKMGVEPFLISSTLIMCVTQRLIRLVCDKCRESYVAPSQILKRIGVTLKKGEEITLYRASKEGCKYCDNIGYKGRIGIFEVMEINDTIRGLIVDQRPTHDIEKAAKLSGMITIKESAAKKVLSGIITVEELFRIGLEN